MDTSCTERLLAGLVVLFQSELILHAGEVFRISFIAGSPCLVQLAVSLQGRLAAADKRLEVFEEFLIRVIAVLDERLQRIPVVELVLAAGIAGVSAGLRISRITRLKLRKEQDIGIVPELGRSSAQLLGHRSVVHALGGEIIDLAIDRLLAGDNTGLNGLIILLLIDLDESLLDVSLLVEEIPLAADRLPAALDHHAVLLEETILTLDVKQTALSDAFAVKIVSLAVDLSVARQTLLVPEVLILTAGLDPAALELHSAVPVRIIIYAVDEAVQIPCTVRIDIAFADLRVRDQCTGFGIIRIKEAIYLLPDICPLFGIILSRR